MNDFENFKKELPNKEKFYSSLTNKKIMKINGYIFLMVRINLKRKKCKIIKACI